MDVLVITWNYPPRLGGIESLIGNLCNGLRSKHSVFVVTSYAKTEANECDTFHAPLPGLLPFALYALWRGALLLLRNPEVHIVFGGSALVAPLVLVIARAFRRRAIVLTHGLDVVYRGFLYQQLCVSRLKSCDRIIANSIHTAHLAESKGVARERLTVIPPGVEPERFKVPTDVVATKRHWNLEGQKVILFVGRLAKRKGIREFIENSLVQIAREVPGVRFVIVGDNPSASLSHRDDVISEIRAAITKTELRNCAHPLGPLSDDEVMKLYQACDVVVLPALNMNDDVEGFGIVTLEAAAASKPVVATRVGGIPDAVEDGKSGILVEPGDYEALSVATISLLSDSDLSLSMGSYAHRRANKEYSWCKIVARYEAVFAATTSDPR